MTSFLVALALAATEGPGVDQYLSATRAEAPLVLDGKVDEAAWQAAPVFDAFLQSYPESGQPPSERTELRVLFDDDFLYVAFICFDRHPGTLLTSLSRRDDIPTSDRAAIGIDTRHDHRSAFVFEVNAGGVMLDGVLTQDTQFTNTWDAVWDARVARRPDGWSAELKIPLAVLSGSTSDAPTWGFFAKRELPRTHETITSVVIPRNANANVSRWGQLRGVQQRSGASVEWLPYVAARAVLAPEVDGVPEPRVVRPSADVGLDVKVQLNRELQLNATVNPDFGQLEADQILQNLSNTELFFPERRPFFTQGLDVFLPVGASGGRSPHTLFYSRRIGLQTPIFAAGKLTGSIGSTQVGVLDAVVTGPWVPLQPNGKKRRAFGYHLEKPLHFGLEDELPSDPVTSTNYFAGVVRQQATTNAAFGVSVASAVPLGALDVPGGNAAAFDWKLSSDSGDWGWLGQFEGSVVTGPKERTLRDGTRLRAFDGGWGVYTRAGKLGGEPFRARLDAEWASPTLELNQTGYLQNQNFGRVQGSVGIVQTGKPGFFSERYYFLGTAHNVSTDGRAVYRGGGTYVNLETVTSTFDFVGVSADVEYPRYDIREVGSTGIPMGRGGGAYFDVYFETDGARVVSLSGDVAYGYHFPIGAAFGGTSGFGGTVSARLRVHPRLSTELTVALDYTPHGPRYVDTVGEGLYRFGNLNSRYLSVTLRQQVILTPRLTLQGYAQLYTDATHTSVFFEAGSPFHQPIRLSDLVPVTADEQIERSSALNFNVVLRWEYRLGSTLYAVYARSQQGAPAANVRGLEALSPDNLFAGPATDSFLVKWSYWWG